MDTNVLATAKSTKYPLDAFIFVQKGLDSTVRRIHGDDADDSEANPCRHVTGTDLCLGLRDYAIEHYGLLARTVLQRWSIHSCEDFGRIVFALVDAKLMLANEDDTIDDFIGAFDFTEAFTPNLCVRPPVT